MHKQISSGILFLSVFSMTACTTSQQVSYQSGGLTHTFVAGKEAGKGSFLLPIYPNAKATGEVSAQNDEEKNSFMMLSSNDPVDKIAEFYKSQLKQEGWTIKQQQMLPELVNISAQKDKLEGSIMLSSDGKKKTSINLSVCVDAEGNPEPPDEKYEPDKFNPPTD